jgi:hypothetical protein
MNKMIYLLVPDILQLYHYLPFQVVLEFHHHLFVYHQKEILNKTMMQFITQIVDQYFTLKFRYQHLI